MIVSVRDKITRTPNTEIGRRKNIMLTQHLEKTTKLAMWERKFRSEKKYFRRESVRKNGRILMTTLGECTEPEEVLRKAYKYL